MLVFVQSDLCILGKLACVEELGISLNPVVPVPEAVDQDGVALSDFHRHLELGPNLLDVQVEIDAKELRLFVRHKFDCTNDFEVVKG